MKVLHLAIYNRNIGDNALNYVIDTFLDQHFDDVTQYDFFKKVWIESDIVYLNSFDAIVIGGGGLLTSHNINKKNKNLPWGSLFRIKNDLLRQLTAKLVFYGVGYNHFYDDPGISSQMLEMISILKEKGGILSVRNDGSKERVDKQLPAHLKNFVTEVPDPALMFKLNPQAKEHTVINIAMDRWELRYGSISNLKEVVQQCVNTFSNCVFMPHTPPDTKLFEMDWFRSKYFHLPLYNDHNEIHKAWDTYARAKLVIYTRGHGQLIAYGNEIPNLGIVTHPKVEYFGRQHGIEDYMSTDNFSEFLQHKFDYSKQISIMRERNHEFVDQLDDFNISLLKMLKG